MATPLSTLVTQVRTELIESSASFWTDAELLTHLIDGAKDMWAAIIDTFGDHYLKIDAEHVTLEAGQDSLSGVPANVFRVNMIEPRDTTTAGPHNGMAFIPRKYNHPDFIAARAFGGLSDSGGAASISINAGVIFYDVSGVGAPNGAPTILTAPRTAAQVLIRLAYNPILDPLDASSNNPIPGEADKALKAYAVSFARAKEREDRGPDPGWLAVYATEKQSILTRITPRQDQEPEEVEGMFEHTRY
jgi:hypothetical protein